MSLLPAPSKNNQTPTPHENAMIQNLLGIHNMLSAHYSRFDDLLSILKQMNGELINLSQRYSEAEGVPHGHHISIFNAAATTGTIYTSASIDINGSLRTLTIGGTGNITVTITDKQGRTGMIGTFPMNGGSIDISTRAKVGIGYRLNISTDAVSTPVVALSAWVEPSALNSENQYRIRNY